MCTRSCNVVKHTIDSLRFSAEAIATRDAFTTATRDLREAYVTIHQASKSSPLGCIDTLVEHTRLLDKIGMFTNAVRDCLVSGNTSLVISEYQKLRNIERKLSHLDIPRVYVDRIFGTISEEQNRANDATISKLVDNGMCFERHGLNKFLSASMFMTVRSLVKKGLIPCEYDVATAILQDDVHMTRFLYNAMATDDERFPCLVGETALLKGSTRMMKLFVRLHKDRLNDFNGSLLCTVCKAGNVEAFDLLVANGALLERNDFAPVRIAIAFKQYTIIERIMSQRLHSLPIDMRRMIKEAYNQDRLAETT